MVRSSSPRCHASLSSSAPSSERRHEAVRRARALWAAGRGVLAGIGVRPRPRRVASGVRGTMRYENPSPREVLRSTGGSACSASNAASIATCTSVFASTRSYARLERHHFRRFPPRCRRRRLHCSQFRHRQPRRRPSEAGCKRTSSAIQADLAKVKPRFRQWHGVETAVAPHSAVARLEKRIVGWKNVARIAVAQHQADGSSSLWLGKVLWQPELLEGCGWHPSAQWIGTAFWSGNACYRKLCRSRSLHHPNGPRRAIIQWQGLCLCRQERRKPWILLHIHIAGADGDHVEGRGIYRIEHGARSSREGHGEHVVPRAVHSFLSALDLKTNLQAQRALGRAGPSTPRPVRERRRRQTPPAASTQQSCPPASP